MKLNEEFENGVWLTVIRWRESRVKSKSVYSIAELENRSDRSRAC